MSNFAFRDSSVVIIETGSTSVRATFGLAELLKLPSVEVDARVGLKRTGESSTQPQVHINDYLVGHKLNEALEAGEDLSISWPFQNGDIKDFKAAEAIWKYILFDQLKLKRIQNESPVLLTFPHGLSRDAHERVCQIFFERFNSAAVSTLERPLAQLYAANSLNGLVVEIGRNRTDVAPIYECTVQHNCVDFMPIGIEDCERYLAKVFKGNEPLIQTLSPPEAPLSEEQLDSELLALVQQVWMEGNVRLGEVELGAPEEEGVTNIAAVLVAGKEKSIIEANQKKKTKGLTAAEQARAREIEALDLITVEFKGKEVTVGRERHRLLDPLFDPKLISGQEGFEQKEWAGGHVNSLQDACGQAVAKAELDARVSIWNAVLITGDCASAVKGIGTALKSRLTHYMMGNADIHNEAQAKQAYIVHTPEYFAEYREQGDKYAAFLGASIVAKVIFSDPNGKNFVSKADYGSKGPRAILEMSASLL